MEISGPTGSVLLLHGLTGLAKAVSKSIPACLYIAVLQSLHLSVQYFGVAISYKQ